MVKIVKNDKLEGYVDADHAGDPDEGYSTTGYIFYFAGGPLDWKSQRQTIVTLSTVEAEYVALSKAGQEFVYLRDLMSSVGLGQVQATTVHEDNSGALKLATTDHYLLWTAYIREYDDERVLFDSAVLRG